jgi:DNA primase
MTVAGDFDGAFIAEVRSRNDIVSVVSDYVTLKKAGTSMKGLCPFHGEKTPSFHVHADRQFFYCFGCQAGGDVISFIREMNGFSFPEAVRHLANRVGLAVPEPTQRRGPRESRESSKEARDVYYHVNRLASRFFVESLSQEGGARARAYLKERGVDAQAAARFDLGFAPDRWDALAQYLVREGADLRAAELLGLIVPRGDPRAGAYDRFRNRLMFPIRNLAGEVVGFSGRDLGGSTLTSGVSRDGEAPPTPAKYVNSPESPIYTKGEQLYGLHEARQSIRRLQTAVLVEGNLDLVRLHQAGITHAVAPLGTALTDAQLRVLKRFAPRVIALYDGDGAGREAAKKAVHLALAEKVVIEVAALPAGSDPDSFISSHGTEALERLLGAAVPGWEYLIDGVLEETRGVQSAQGARLAVERLAPVLADIEDDGERALLEGKLASVLDVPAGMVRQISRGQTRRRAAPQAPQPGNGAGAPPVSARARAPLPARELKLLELLVMAPDVRPLFVGLDGLTNITHADVRASIDAVLKTSGDVSSALDAIPDPSLRAAMYRRLAEVPTLTDAARTRREFDHQMRGLQCDAIARRVEALRREEKRAGLTSDETRAMTLMRDRLALERQLEQLRNMRG